MQQPDAPTAKKFAQDRNETLTSPIWSDFETIILSVVAKTEEITNCQDIKKVHNAKWNKRPLSFQTLDLQNMSVITLHVWCSCCTVV